MKVQQLLAHHGIAENPFGQEDAQSDHVFRQLCLDGTHHPAWDKIYSNPESPATSVVFGEKGSGKTALRMQMIAQLEQHNRRSPDKRVFIIEYDDFNPFLDSFRERLRGRRSRPDKALANWRLWDHMDAILSLGVTRLAEAINNPGQGRAENVMIEPERLERLNRQQKRDLLLLDALYEHSYAAPARRRWAKLRRKLRYSNWTTFWAPVLGILVTLATLGLVWYLEGFREIFQWWVAAIIAAGWLPFAIRELRLFWQAWKISRQVRVFDHQPNVLRRILSRIPGPELIGQPLPDKDRSDDRYELLMKFQSILQTLGHPSIIVVVDRVDEPQLVNGNAERMRELLWPMFDNKFLKHPGIGFKLLLPAEVVQFLRREEKEFYERSRLDKQNLVESLQWTGESLYDVANARIRACAKSGEQPSVQELFDESISESELISTFARLRVPRHLFRFMHRLLVEHCNRYTEANPSWKINRETTQSILALYMRDLDAFDRGLGTG